MVQKFSDLGVSEEFASLLPRVARSDRPVYVLWVFNPDTDTALIEDPSGKPRAEQRYHEELAKQVPHPDRVHGYAYSIRDGWRITDWEHRPLDDAHIKRVVRRTLDREQVKPLVGGREARLVLTSKT